MSRTLSDFRCPVHGCDLVLRVDWGGDEGGVYCHHYFECPATGHTYHAEWNGPDDYWPIDEEADDEPTQEADPCET